MVLLLHSGRCYDAEFALLEMPFPMVLLVAKILMLMHMFYMPHAACTCTCTCTCNVCYTLKDLKFSGSHLFWKRLPASLQDLETKLESSSSRVSSCRMRASLGSEISAVCQS